jgi:hypothetical protein
MLFNPQSGEWIEGSVSLDFQRLSPLPDLRSVSARCRLSLAAFLTAQYHATPLSHTCKQVRLRVCFWLAPFLS